MLRLARSAALGCLLALLAVVAAATPAGAATAPSPATSKRVILAFWTAYPGGNLTFAEHRYEPHDMLLRQLAARPALSLGLFSSVQGDYSQEQALLDITQGTRQSASLYSPKDPFKLALDRSTQSFTQWAPTLRRAHRVSVTLQPGLLASSIPGGAAYAGVSGRNTLTALAAADRRGRVDALSLGSVATLVRRARALSASRRLVVVGLPPDPAGMRALDAPIGARSPGELLIVAQLPPTPAKYGFDEPPPRFFKQPALAIAGGGKRGSIVSDTTRHDGLVSAIDIAPTVLDHLGLTVPPKMRGTDIRLAPPVSAQRLEALRRRWADVRAQRQSSSLRGVVALAGVIFLALGLLKGLQAAIAPALRIGALGMMWWPTAVLGAAVIEPQRRLFEIALIAAPAVALGALTDRLVRWPRGPLVPAVAALVAYTADLASGGDLLARSALGPSVAFGARFYGVSNELEPLLPMLLLVGLAAALSGRAITRRTPVIYALAGLALGVVVGWGRLGADVGGVITVGLAVAVATLVMLPGGITKRAVVIAALVPVAAIAGLILLDLGLSGGDHLSRNLLRAENTRELWELVSRRYELAFRVLKGGRTPAYFLGAALAVGFAVRNRAWLYHGMPHRAWSAALIGGLAAGLAGMLANDSGPVLLINAVVALGAVTAYIVGGVRTGEAPRPVERPPSAEPARSTRPADPVLTP